MTRQSLEVWLDGLLGEVRGLGVAAGEVIMHVYQTAFDVAGKSDGSPVTEADARAEALILDGLRRLTPDIPVVAEESVAAGDIPHTGSEFWLVDPLDGTREFISRNGEFTVNIALVREGVPVLGVVYAPAIGVLYEGAAGLGATRTAGGLRQPVCVRQPPAAGLTVVASRSHGDMDEIARFLGGRSVASLIQVGSSLKLCRVAEGAADLYPRLGRTMEWDIAAGQAVLEAAGGSVTTLDGTPLRYGKPGFENPHFVASGARA
jgi:3'(2'), 5'-bisphosphate nucleotidase